MAAWSTNDRSMSTTKRMKIEHLGPSSTRPALVSMSRGRCSSIVAVLLALLSSAVSEHPPDIVQEIVVDDVLTIREDVDVATDNVVATAEEGTLFEPVVETEYEKLVLFQRDPVEVGHVQEIEIAPDRVITLKTIAVKPPLFEVWNLLSPEECDYIIELGKKEGLIASATVTDTFDNQYGVYGDDGVTLVFNDTQWNETFNEYDVDQDGYIDYREVNKCLPGVAGTDRELSLAQVQRLYDDFFMDSDSNGLLNLKEFWVMMNRNMAEDIVAWLARLDGGEVVIEESRRGRDRISEQAWVDWFNKWPELNNRLSAMTGLHPYITRTSEKMQVVRYYPGGHYHAHYDSSNIEQGKDCVHTKMKLEGAPPNHPKGRLCRFITIMYYLSDVEEGGETAFPLADNETYTVEGYNDHERNLTDLSSPKCQEKNAVLRPEKGKVVMWYNHFIDPETGWVGVLDAYSLHGGCDVLRGVKWIANNWITVDNVYQRQILHHREYYPLPTQDEDTTDTIEPDAPGSNGDVIDANDADWTDDASRDANEHLNFDTVDQEKDEL